MADVFNDSHAHLNDEAFAEDLEKVLERAGQAGVGRIINVGYDEPSSVLALEQAVKYPALLATVGLHPHDAAKFTESTIAFLDSLASDPRVAAVGETGLDYHYMNSPAEMQKEAFSAHLDLGELLRLPVMIHCRSAYPDMIEILKGRPRAAGHTPWLVHCFSGGAGDLDELIGLDCYFSLGGSTTFRNFKGRDQVARIPSDRLLLETDSPYLAPHPKRGTRNEPALIVHTARTVAEMRNCSLEELSRITGANFDRIFNIPQA
ncbi:MAG: TatD family hydrolase [Gemmatimonadota bacterium]|nr:TatD family hydrolase [Gemmatimonadota bacterium]